MDGTANILERRFEQQRRLKLAALFCAIVVCVEIYFEFAARRHQSQQCLEQLAYSLGPMARVWADANGGRLPTNYDCLTNIPGVSNQPRFWICPSDSRNPMATERDWARFKPALADYQLISSGVPESETNAVLFSCKIHGYVVYADGSVYDGKTRGWQTNVSVKLLPP